MSLVTKIVHRIYDKPNIDIDICSLIDVLQSLAGQHQVPWYRYMLYTRHCVPQWLS